MSLLLDALKKAAEKKAGKSDDHTESIDPTDIADIEDTLAPNQQDDTALTEATSPGHEPTQLDDAKHVEATEIDTTSTDNAEIERTGFNADTELDYQGHLTDEDETLIFEEVDEQSEGEIDETTLAALTDIDILANVAEEDEDLTKDDVTEFMGDGYNGTDLSESYQQAASERSDDTTITNSDSLILTNLVDPEDDQAEQSSAQVQDQTESDTFSLHEHDDRVAADQAVTEGLNLRGTPESKKSTHVETDSTSTVSSVDIEKLTNDETVTVESGVTTRSFAPDNYDRTLLNLSESDASKIFPGLRPDSDTVMTPDYAKKVFLSKSGQVKTRYYKMYAGVGLLLLLAVVMWGLFQLQEESDLIDQGLVSLKRDPMPGIIKPPAEEVSQSLFATADETDNKIIDIIAKADEPESEQTGGLVEDLAKKVSEPESAEPTEVKKEQVKVVQEEVTEVVVKSKPSLPGPVTEKKSLDNTKKAEAKKPATSSFSISSSSQVSQKDLLLAEAYEAYEQGDMSSARSLYNKVLVLDDSSRDGILGRAAVHVQDREYQQAINKYQQLLVANPKDSMAMTSLISVANIDPQSGETQLKTLLREQPDSPYLYFALGNMYGSQSRWNEAQSAYFDALQKKPEDPNYAYNLAVSLEHIGKADTAREFYQRALDSSSKGLVTFDSQLVQQRLELLGQ